jgi:hypothetical protein
MTERYKAPVEGVDLREYPEVVQYACKYGMVVPGWTLADYLRDAAKNQGYELLIIHGPQGCGKSTFALQALDWIYGDWETVLDSVVFHPKQFVEHLKAIPKGSRTPAVLWDDLTVNFDSQKFKTDAELYGAIDSAFAAIRVKASVIIVTTPTMNRVPAVLRDHCSLEVFIGRNQVFLAERIFHSPMWDKLRSRLTKILIEGPRPFDMYDTPTPIYRRYYTRREDLTEDTLNQLGDVAPEDFDNLDNYIWVWDVAKLCSLSPASITQLGSKGTMPTKRIGDKLYLPKEFMDELIEVYPLKA